VDAGLSRIEIRICGKALALTKDPRRACRLYVRFGPKKRNEIAPPTAALRQHRTFGQWRF